MSGVLASRLRGWRTAGLELGCSLLLGATLAAPCASDTRHTSTFIVIVTKQVIQHISLALTLQIDKMSEVKIIPQSKFCFGSLNAQLIAYWINAANVVCNPELVLEKSIGAHPSGESKNYLQLCWKQINPGRILEGYLDIDNDRFGILVSRIWFGLVESVCNPLFKIGVCIRTCERRLPCKLNLIRQ